MRRRWIGLYCWREQRNLIVDRGLGGMCWACPASTYGRYKSPRCGNRSSEIRDSIGEVYVGHTCNGCHSRTIAAETPCEEDASFGKYEPS